MKARKRERTILLIIPEIRKKILIHLVPETQFLQSHLRKSILNGTRHKDGKIDILFFFDASSSFFKFILIFGISMEMLNNLATGVFPQL